MAIVELTAADDPEWDAFVEESPHGTTFAKSAWLHGFERLAPGNRSRRLVMRSPAGSIEGALPLFVASSASGRTVVMPPITTYVSLLLPQPQLKDVRRAAETRMRIVAEFMDLLREEAYREVRLEHTPQFDDPREFIWHGWHVAPRYTYWHDIEHDDDPLARLSVKHGQKYRKAARQMYRTSCHENVPQHIEEFLDILPYAYRELPQSISQPLSAAVREFVHAVCGKETLLYYEARDANGILQSARIVLLSPHRTALDWVASTTEAGRSDGATVFLVTEMLRDLRNRGLARFDFCGANMRTIAQFKSGFNGKLVSYFATTKPSRMPFARRFKAAAKIMIRGTMFDRP